MSLDLQSKVKECHTQLEDTTTSTEADNQISTDDTSGIMSIYLYLLNIRPYFAVEYSPIFNPSIFFFIIAHVQTIVRMRNDNYCLCYYGCDPFDAVFLKIC